MINIPETDERVERRFNAFQGEWKSLTVGRALVHRLYAWGYALGYDPDVTTVPYSDLVYDAIRGLLYEELWNRKDHIAVHRSDGYTEASVTPFDKCLFGDTLTLRECLSGTLYTHMIRRDVATTPSVSQNFTWDYPQFSWFVRIAYRHGVEDGRADAYRIVTDEQGGTWIPMDNIQRTINAVTYWTGVTQGESWAIRYIEQRARDPFIAYQDPLFITMTEQITQESLFAEEVREYKREYHLTNPSSTPMHVSHGIPSIEGEIESWHKEEEAIKARHDLERELEIKEEEANE